MCQAIEKVFVQKLASMPTEVALYSLVHFKHLHFTVTDVYFMFTLCCF